MFSFVVEQERGEMGKGEGGLSSGLTVTQKTTQNAACLVFGFVRF